jgi:hypothetical protein
VTGDEIYGLELVEGDQRGGIEFFQCGQLVPHLLELLVSSDHLLTLLLHFTQQDGASSS